MNMMQTTDKQLNYLRQMTPDFRRAWRSTNKGDAASTLELVNSVLSAVTSGECPLVDAGRALQPLLGEEWQLQLFGGELAAIGFHAASLADGPSRRSLEEMQSDWEEITAAATRLNAAWRASGQQPG